MSYKKRVKVFLLTGIGDHVRILVRTNTIILIYKTNICKKTKKIMRIFLLKYGQTYVHLPTCSMRYCVFEHHRSGSG